MPVGLLGARPRPTSALPRSLVPPRSSRGHFRDRRRAKIEEGREEGEGVKAQGGEYLSKRSHRPRVVAGIPGADFICRMSTSRRGQPRDAECEPGTPSVTERTRLEGTGPDGRGEGGSEEEAETVRSCMGPGSDPDQTAINSPLNLSCPTPPIGPRGSYYPRGARSFFLAWTLLPIELRLPIISTLP